MLINFVPPLLKKKKKLVVETAIFQVTVTEERGAKPHHENIQDTMLWEKKKKKEAYFRSECLGIKKKRSLASKYGVTAKIFATPILSVMLSSRGA